MHKFFLVPVFWLFFSLSVYAADASEVVLIDESSEQSILQDEGIVLEETLDLGSNEQLVNDELQPVIIQSIDDTSTVDALNNISEQLDVMTAALEVEASINAYQVSEYYVNYFRGVLQNMPHTDYLCYAERIYTGSAYNYRTYYYLFYDLEFENGQVAAGSYPCIEVYNEDSVYYMNQTTKSFDGYPTLGYASFAPYSALVDRSFHYNDMFAGLVCVLVLFVIGRKTLFS